MKIRKYFVSNSSSTSFLIVGVAGSDQRLANLAIADKADPSKVWGGYTEGRTLVFLGNEVEYDSNDNIISFQPFYAGINAEHALKAGKTVKDLKKEFIAMAHTLGVEFHEHEVDLHYGEVSSE